MPRCTIFGYEGPRSAVWLAYKRGTHQHVSYVLCNGKKQQVDSQTVKLSKLSKNRTRTIDPNTKLTRRVHRYRRPVRVLGVQFKHGETIGDFGKMLDDPHIKHNMVALFNDNHAQWMLADPEQSSFYDHPSAHRSGGGNACVRPFQQLYHAIGMPTGPYTSLDQTFVVHGTTMTVYDIVHAATARVCALFVAHPEKEDLYYSADLNGTIGLGIFAGVVGRDVIEYITACIHAIPRLTEELRKTGKCMSFPLRAFPLREV